MSEFSDGQGWISGVVPLAFDPSGHSLAVGVTVVVDSKSRYGALLYDLTTNSYGAALNTVIASGGAPVDVFQVALAAGVTSPLVFASYRNQDAAEGLAEHHIAVIQAGALLVEDLLTSIPTVRSGADAPIDALRASDDGRFLAIQTVASNLVSESEIDSNGTPDIYLIDRQRGSIERISVMAGQEPIGDVYLSDMLLDDTGTLSIAFYTRDPLVFSALDSNSEDDVYVWRRPGATSDSPGQSTITLISSTSGGAQGGREALLAPTGVYFTSVSSAYSALDLNDADDIFWKTGSSGVVPITPLTLSQKGPSSLSDSSADANQILVLTRSPALVGRETEVDQVVLIDVASQSGRVLSETPDGQLADDAAFSALLSPDGRRAIFVSKAMNLLPESDGGDRIYLFDTGNRAPAGSLTVTGIVLQGETLAVTSTLTDADGIPTAGAGALSYQWLGGGVAINGATGATLTLTQALVGKTISVRGSYVDLQGTAEAVTSQPTVAVANVNDAPTGADKTVSTSEDTAYVFSAADFGFSDVDEGDVLGAVRIDTLPAAGAGLLKLGGVAVTAGQVIPANEIGGLRFDPALNANGVGLGSLGFSVRDTALFDAQPNTLTLNVAPVNDAPIASAMSVTTSEDAATSGSLPASDADVDTLSFVKVSDPQHGSVVIGTGGAFTYTPAANYNGTDNFSFRVDDGQLQSAPATVTITVFEVNDPVTGSVNISGPARQGLTLSAILNLADIEGLPSGESAYRYQWFAGSSPLAGATSDTLPISAAMVGLSISVQVAFNDLLLNREAIRSAQTEFVVSAAVHGLVLSGIGERPIPSVNFSISKSVPSDSTGKIDWATSNASGTWSFDKLDFDQFVIRPWKKVTEADSKAISAADALATLKIAHGRSPNADPDGPGSMSAPGVSPYQLISADFDRDGRVTERDARAILREADSTAYRSAGLADWLFVSEKQDLSLSSRANVPGPEPFLVETDLVSNVQLIGLLLGDIDGNWGTL